MQEAEKWISYAKRLEQQGKQATREYAYVIEKVFASLNAMQKSAIFVEATQPQRPQLSEIAVKQIQAAANPSPLFKPKRSKKPKVHPDIARYRKEKRKRKNVIPDDLFYAGHVVGNQSPLFRQGRTPPHHLWLGMEREEGSSYFHHEGRGS